MKIDSKDEVTCFEHLSMLSSFEVCFARDYISLYSSGGTSLLLQRYVPFVIWRHRLDEKAAPLGFGEIEPGLF